MTKYNQSWAQVNRPADQKLELVPALIVLVAVQAVIILQLINNCGGV